jgi:hypothetical protein
LGGGRYPPPLKWLPAVNSCMLPAFREFLTSVSVVDIISYDVYLNR